MRTKFLPSALPLFLPFGPWVSHSFASELYMEHKVSQQKNFGGKWRNCNQMSHPCLEGSVSNLWPKLSPPWTILRGLCMLNSTHSARHKEVSKTFPKINSQKDRATPLPSTLQCIALGSQPTEQCFFDCVGLNWAYTLAD